MLAIAVVALVVRLVFSFTAGEAQPVKGDALAFHELAGHLADGDGYVSVSLGSDQLRPSATHPPAFPVLLAALDLVGIRSVGAHRVALALLGALGVGLLGLLGQRLAGSAVGLVAAGIAALHPLWVEPGGVLMSEALHLVVITGVLLLAVLVLEQPALPRLIGLGLVMGAAVLTRSESVVLVGADRRAADLRGRPFGAGPAAHRRRHRGRPGGRGGPVDRPQRGAGRLAHAVDEPRRHVDRLVLRRHLPVG